MNKSKTIGLALMMMMFYFKKTARYYFFNAKFIRLFMIKRRTYSDQIEKPDACRLNLTIHASTNKSMIFKINQTQNEELFYINRYGYTFIDAYFYIFDVFERSTAQRLEMVFTSRIVWFSLRQCCSTTNATGSSLQTRASKSHRTTWMTIYK